MLDITLLPSAKVPLIYPDTNGMTTEWYRFFWNVYGFTGDSTGTVPVSKGGTGLNSIGNHQLIIGNSLGLFERTELIGSGITIGYAPGTVTLAIGNSGVTPGTYGSATAVGQFQVDIHGTLVFAQNVPIAIDANQIVSGTINTARISGSYTGITGVGTLTVGTWNATTIGTAYGGTGLTSFTSGGALYATSTSVLTSGTLPVTAGGTGQTSFTNGQLLIGNTTGNTLDKATLTAGTGINISNGAGAITITNTLPSLGGTVTSVGLSLPAEFTVTNSPVTSSGTLTATWASETAKYFFAAPNATAGTPSFRAIVASDIPSLSGTYIPYAGASSAIDLNAETVTNIAHLGIGTTTVPTILLRAFGDNGTESRIAMRGYSSNANGSAIRVTKFRGTYPSPQVPQSGDSLGRFEFAGYCTTSANGQVGVSLEGITTEMWGATALGSKLQFKVTPNTTTTPVLALTIDQDKSATFASSVTATSFSGSGSGLTSIPNSALTNSTISGVALGGNLFNLTAGTGVSFSAGTTYNGSTAITINATGTGGTVTSVTGTSPISVATGTTTPVISISQANTTTDGYLTSTDWNTFNGKSNTNGTVTNVAALTLGTIGTDLSSTVANGTTTPVITLQVPTASATNRGALSSTDWSTFNGKANTFTYTSNYIPYGQGTTTPTQSVGLQYNGTTFTTTGISTSNNLTFTGTGNRITGLFDGATVANRVLFQTSTTNGNTSVGIIPNGTGVSPNLIVYNNSDPTNASRTRITVNTASSQIHADTSGTGTYLPLAIYTNNSERARFFISGGVSIGNTTDPGAGVLSVEGGITTPAYIQMGDSYPFSAIKFGTNGSFIGRNSADGSLIIDSGQANIVFAGGSTSSYSSLATISTSTGLFSLPFQTQCGNDYTSSSFQIGNQGEGEKAN